MPFSMKTIDFLTENRINDSKTWFEEHKAEYKKLVTEPFCEIIEKLSPVLAQIDDEIVCSPRCISRIYRDVRFSNDKSLFRDSMWCSFRHPRQPREPMPELYFAISPDGFEFGCGFYCAGTANMEAMRSLILSGDKSFKAADKAYRSADRLVMGGDSYKKSRFPDRPENEREWLDRKNIYFNCGTNDPTIVFGDDLADYIAEGFNQCAPIFHFLMKARNLAVMSVK